MNILFYQPYNQTVVYIESVAEVLATRGHRLFFLSHAEKGDCHKNMEKFGVTTFSEIHEKKNFLMYYFNRVKALVAFCRKHEIEIVYSHFQEANLVASIAQLFCKAKFILTRHHSDCAYQDNNFNEKMGDWIINKLSKYYVATSKKVYNQIVEKEKTYQGKVRLINYGYNFTHFLPPNSSEVFAIKSHYPAQLLIVKAARFIPEKRHMMLFRVVNRLVHEGYDIKVLLLSRGPEQERLEKYIKDHRLEDHLIMIGFKTNVQDYFAAADLVVHLSVSEASNSAMKEAGLVETPVVVCKDVGDFDDYIVNGVNGFALSKEAPEEELYELLKNAYNNKEKLNLLGMKLRQSVVDRFAILKVISEYEVLHKDLGVPF